MPRLSDATTEATIVAWLVPDGTVVRVGEELVEIEADKATTSWSADAEGVLSIAVPAGETVLTGTTIARIGAHANGNGNGTHVTGNGTPANGNGNGNGTPATGNGTPTSGDASGSVETATGADPAGTGPATRNDDVRDTVSSGPADRTHTATAADDRPANPTDDARAADASRTAPEVATTPSPADAPVLRQPSRIERLVSERMVQSRTEIPEFTASVEIDMSGALALRADLKTVGAPGGGGRTPSINDLLVKACALALVDHPRIRSAWTDEGVLEHARIDVGVAVATDDGGLVVPVVRGADRLGLAGIAATTRDLTGRARKGRITPAEMAGATFSISNLGAMGVAHFAAIIGPGQGAILAVGATIDRYVPVDGEPVLRPICTVTLSSDHRVIYGAHAAAFLERLRTILEHPGALAF